MEFNTYDGLITFAKSQQIQRFFDFKNKGLYFKGHHIIPKYLGGKGYSRSWDHSNIVHLTIKEHVLAHYLLALENESNLKVYYGNISAAFLIISSKKDIAFKAKIKAIEDWLKDKDAQLLIQEIRKRMKDCKGANKGKKFPQPRQWVQIGYQCPVSKKPQNMQKFLDVYAQKYGYTLLPDCPICHQPNTHESFACCQEHAQEYLNDCKKKSMEIKSQLLSNSWKNRDNTERLKKIGESNKKHINERIWITDGQINKAHLLKEPIPE
jgi:hypothetical protein